MAILRDQQLPTGNVINVLHIGAWLSNLNPRVHTHPQMTCEPITDRRNTVERTGGAGQ